MRGRSAALHAAEFGENQVSLAPVSTSLNLRLQGGRVEVGFCPDSVTHLVGAFFNAQAEAR
jgi:hypothetical protein